MFIAAPEDNEDTARLYRADAESPGFVMNLTRAWAWRPDVFEGFGALRAQLTTKSSLSKREQGVIVCATAAELGDSYCSLAWGKMLADAAGSGAAAAVIGNASCDQLSDRERALAAWCRQVVDDPSGTRARDVAALRDAGFSDQEVFEATVFVAFRLAFSTVNGALGIAPDWQLREAAPQEVREAVGYGRPAAAKPR